MLNIFCFREERYRYFGCVPIQIALGLAVFIAFATQYYSIIFFLIQQEWYWFICLAITLIAHAILFWAIYSRKSILFYPIMIYQVLFIILMIGCIVWLTVDLFSQAQSRIFQKCFADDPDQYNCKQHTRILAGINIAVFFACALLNIFVLDVCFRFRFYIDTAKRSPTVHVVDQPSSVERQTFRDRTHNTIYSPGNPYQPQPIQPEEVSAPIHMPQHAYNPSYQPYPTIRGPTAPVYPSSSSDQLRPNAHYDAPPAYSQAVNDKY